MLQHKRFVKIGFDAAENGPSKLANQPPTPTLGQINSPASLSVPAAPQRGLRRLPVRAASVAQERFVEDNRKLLALPQCAERETG